MNSPTGRTSGLSWFRFCSCLLCLVKNTVLSLKLHRPPFSQTFFLHASTLPITVVYASCYLSCVLPPTLLVFRKDSIQGSTKLHRCFDWECWPPSLPCTGVGGTGETFPWTFKNDTLVNGLCWGLSPALGLPLPILSPHPTPNCWSWMVERFSQEQLHSSFLFKCTPTFHLRSSKLHNNSSLLLLLWAC